MHRQIERIGANLLLWTGRTCGNPESYSGKSCKIPELGEFGENLGQCQLRCTRLMRLIRFRAYLAESCPNVERLTSWVNANCRRLSAHCSKMSREPCARVLDKRLQALRALHSLVPLPETSRSGQHHDTCSTLFSRCRESRLTRKWSPPKRKPDPGNMSSAFEPLTDWKRQSDDGERCRADQVLNKEAFYRAKPDRV